MKELEKIPFSSVIDRAWQKFLNLLISIFLKAFINLRNLQDYWCIGASRWNLWFSRKPEIETFLRIFKQCVFSLVFKKRDFEILLDFCSVFRQQLGRVGCIEKYMGSVKNFDTTRLAKCICSVLPRSSSMQL